MKLMFCGSCGDVVAPDSAADLLVRWCRCRRHAVWWLDGAKGLLRVHDSQNPARKGGEGGMAWVIGLHNGVLVGEGLVDWAGQSQCTSKAEVERLLAATPDSYLFKRSHSLIVRFAPGYTGDTAWSPLPPGSQSVH